MGQNIIHYVSEITHGYAKARTNQLFFFFAGLVFYSVDVFLAEPT